MRVAVTSVACENLAKQNVAKPNGWRYFTIHDRVRINEWNPDVIVCLGWFCADWSDWQSHVANFGDTKKIIIQWVGTDILTLKQSYDRGHKFIVEWLKSDRFIHVMPTQESFKEMAWTGFDLHGPIDVPAEHLIEPQPMPEKVRLAVYMPPDRQDFYGMELLKIVLPRFRKQAAIVFYHWLDKTQDIDYSRKHEEHFALNREEYEERILKGCSALVRVPVHDAGSISVGEFLMAGKPVVTNQRLPLWKHGVKGALYVEEMGNFRLAERADEKLEAEIRNIIDLVKNSKQPVPQKTMDHYRNIYDPAEYGKALSGYAEKQWGVTIESAAG